MEIHFFTFAVMWKDKKKILQGEECFHSKTQPQSLCRFSVAFLSLKLFFLSDCDDWLIKIIIFPSSGRNDAKRIIVISDLIFSLQKQMKYLVPREFKSSLILKI